MVAEVVFAYEMRPASARVDVRAMRTKGQFYVRLLHSRVRFTFLNKKGPSRLKGQPCCRAMKR